MVEAYCVKCKAKREMVNAKETKMKNGNKAMKGECPKCGTKMFRIMGK
jgi:Zn finger protein HypA/HybF involved in hydrogenase expression